MSLPTSSELTLEREIQIAVVERLSQLKYDRTIIKHRIRRCKDKKVIRALRKLNSLLEATERALNDV